MKSGRKVWVASISAAALLLAALLATDAIETHGSSASPEPGVSAANDAAATRVARPPADPTNAGIAANLPVIEYAPLTSRGTGEKDARRTTQAVVGNEPPVADSSTEKKPDPRPGTVSAECWGLRGNGPRDYVVTLDQEVRTSGRASALITAQRENRGYATMFQTSSAAPVRGRRVEFSADVRTQGATGGANLLFRAEDEHGRTVAFDNMQTYGADGRPDQLNNRGFKGNTEWSTQRVVVDIPDSARVITYGVSLFGGGKAWIDNARIEVVTDDMAPTGIPVDQWPSPPNGIPVNPASLTRSPRNLEFDLEAQARAAPCN